MKTALQTFIAWGDEMIKNNPNKVLSFAEAIDKAEELLAMEKEQIEDAYNNGDLRSAELYYNETYVGSNLVCTCTNFRETPMINGKYICSICNKPITKEDKQ